MLLRSLIWKALSLAAAETVRRQVGRWLKGEISVQDLWDRRWRGSRSPQEANEKKDLELPTDPP